MSTQAFAALEKANGIRFARAEDKKTLGSRDVRAAQQLAIAILDNPPDHWLTAPLADLLDPIRFVGPLTIGRWLRQADIRRNTREFTPIAKLTDRERTALRDVLAEWSPSWAGK